MSTSTATATKKEAALPTDEKQSPEDGDGKDTRPSSEVQWAALVDQIKAGEDSGMEQLYHLFGRGIRYYLCHQLGPQELEDKVHETFLIVVSAIRRGDLREPERLMGFVRTVVRRQVAGYIERIVQRRRDEAELETGACVPDRTEDPEQQLMIRQKAELMRTALTALSTRERDILERFYLHEQTQDQICRELSLTDTQFRLLNSRAKAKFGEIGQKKLKGAGMFSFRERAKAS